MKAMNKLLVVFFVLLQTTDVMSCAVPIQGEKYNELIKVIKLDSDFEQFNHAILLPKIVEGRPLESIRISVFNKLQLEPAFVFEPKTIEKDSKLVSAFYLGSDEYTAYVSIWWTGPCPIIGKKVIQLLETK